jgi:hypothetical protein
MAVSRALRRLLRIRDLEEEQCRLALDSAVGELNRLESAKLATAERDRRGRGLVNAGAQTGQLPDRLAGIEEVHTAGRFFAALEPRIASKQEEIVERRQEFLMKRLERRQAETLIEETEARDAIDDERRNQQGLDSWYSGRLYRAAVERAVTERAATETDSRGAGNGRFAASTQENDEATPESSRPEASRQAASNLEDKFI